MEVGNPENPNNEEAQIKNLFDRSHALVFSKAPVSSKKLSISYPVPDEDSVDGVALFSLEYVPKKGNDRGLSQIRALYEVKEKFAPDTPPASTLTELKFTRDHVVKCGIYKKEMIKGNAILELISTTTPDLNSLSELLGKAEAYYSNGK